MIVFKIFVKFPGLVPAVWQTIPPHEIGMGYDANIIGSDGYGTRRVQR